MFVNLVGHHEKVGIFGHHVGDAFKLVFGVEHSGGVARAAEHNELGFGCDGFFDLFRSYLEIVFDGGFNVNAFAASHTYYLLVRNPARGGDYNLVARVDKALHQLVDGLFGSGGNNNLFGFEIEVVVAFELVAHGLAQVGVAGHGGIVRKVVVDSLFGGLFHQLGGVEIGFADAQADNVLALSFQLTGFLCHSKSL